MQGSECCLWKELTSVRIEDVSVGDAKRKVVVLLAVP